MASGRAHEVANIVGLTLLAGGYALVVANTPVQVSFEVCVVFTSAYLLGTFWITPDLDLAERKRGTVRPKKHWGRLGWLWYPYGRRFKHRGVSHTWLLGPLQRFIYFSLILAIVLGILWLLLYNIGLDPFTFFTFHAGAWWRVLGIGLLGYYVSQWMHLVIDGVPLSHGQKLMQRSKPKRRKS